MERWRYVVVWADFVMIWRGIDIRGRSYPLTAARRTRLEELLGDAIELAAPGQSWTWSWNDWHFDSLGGT